MNRRDFVKASSAAGLVSALGSAGAVASAQSRNMTNVIELRYYWMRNGNQTQRTNDYLKGALLPAAKRAGALTVGFFGGLIAESAPFVLSVASFSSLAAMETAAAKMADDKEFAKAFDSYNSMTELSYDRMENCVLRGFSTFPGIEAPKVEEGKSHIFELRTYEANNVKASKRKIKMFDDGEISIFKKVGMIPVFFGEAIIGTRLPKLTYMLAYDSLAGRDKVWSAFLSDPDWIKLRAMPGLSDAEIVSNISSSLLRPTPYSEIR